MLKFFSSTGSEKVISEKVDDIPTGIIVSYGATTAPTGWLLCDGSEILRTTYAALDSAISTTYGAYTNGSGAAGTTHLRLPDLRGRIPVGQSAGSGNRTDTNGPLVGTGQITGGSAISAGILGASSGAETITLTAAQSAVPAHNHTVTVGTHTHSVSDNGGHRHNWGYNFTSVRGGSAVAGASADATANPATGNITTYSASTGGSLTGNTSGVTVNDKTGESATNAHNNMQPFLVVTYIIKI